jgi:hypothetical protein
MAVPAYQISQNPPIGSKVISGGHRQTDRQRHTHTQVGDLIIQLSFFERWLKMLC